MLFLYSLVPLVHPLRNTAYIHSWPGFVSLMVLMVLLAMLWHWYIFIFLNELWLASCCPECFEVNNANIIIQQYRLRTKGSVKAYEIYEIEGGRDARANETDSWRITKQQQQKYRTIYRYKNVWCSIGLLLSNINLIEYCSKCDENEVEYAACSRLFVNAYFAIHGLNAFFYPRIALLRARTDISVCVCMLLMHYKNKRINISPTFYVPCQW